MQTRRAWALALLLLLPALAPAAEEIASSSEAVPRAPSGRFIEINELISRVAKRTGKQFIVDARVRAEIPLTGLDLDRVDYRRLLAILNVHAFVAFQSGDVVRVVPDAISRQLPIPVTTEIGAKTLDDEMVTLLVHAKHTCAAQAVPVLRPMMPQPAHLAAVVQSNSLVIVDRAANARRIADLFAQLDQAAAPGQKCPEMVSSSRIESKAETK